MKPFSKHIVLIGRMVALALFLTNAGFTAILNNCAMESSDCCCTSSSQRHMQCETPMASNADQASLQSAFKCHTSTVAGGLHETQALLVKSATTQTPISDIPAVVAVGSEVTSTIQPRFQSLTAYAHGVSPPSVEKYVLISKFLI